MLMGSILEKGGGTFQGIRLLLCENPLPPIKEAIAAAQAEVRRSNYYTEPLSEPLGRLIADLMGVPRRLVHINAGSELILRQLFDRFGQRVHLLTPTYQLFTEISQCYTETRLLPEEDFAYDLADLEIPKGTTLKEFAYMIHTEIGEKFLGGMDIKRRKLGADHILENGDIVEILLRG